MIFFNKSLFSCGFDLIIWGLLAQEALFEVCLLSAYVRGIGSRSA